MEHIYKTFSDVLEESTNDMDKYNPYHDKLGRFTSANGSRVTVPNKRLSSGERIRSRHGVKVKDAVGNKKDNLWDYESAEYENALGQTVTEDGYYSYGPEISIHSKNGKLSNNIVTSGARHLTRGGTLSDQKKLEASNSKNLNSVVEQLGAKEIRDKKGNIKALEIPVTDKMKVRAHVPSDMTRLESIADLEDSIDAAFNKEIMNIEWEQARKLPSWDQYMDADPVNGDANMERDIAALDKERGYGISDLKRIRNGIEYYN